MSDKLPQELITTLKKLGYRCVNDIYFKPIGYHILVCKSCNNEIIVANYFLAYTEEILIYNSRVLDDKESYEFDLKTFEADNKYYINANSDFGFLTKEDVWEKLL